jgi:hypothetical protein
MIIITLILKKTYTPALSHIIFYARHVGGVSFLLLLR